MPTPFGVRRRLKRILGMDAAASAAPRAERVAITVVGPKGEEQTGESPKGSTILAASGVLKRPIASGCADSTCGTCRVEVLEGGETLTKADARERATLKEGGFPITMRLACRVEIDGPMKVRAFELT